MPTGVLRGAGWVVRSPQTAAPASLCRGGLVLPSVPLYATLPSRSLFSVTLSLSLSSEALYLWPAASQPVPGTLQDQETTLSCSEAEGREAALPWLPRTGGPHPLGCALPPQPGVGGVPFSVLDPLLAGGERTEMKGQGFAATHLGPLPSCRGDTVQHPRAGL